MYALSKAYVQKLGWKFGKYFFNLQQKFILIHNNYIFLSPNFNELLKFAQCLGGGIGRRVGFKIQCLRTCGFDSHPRYISKTQQAARQSVAFFS